MKSRSIVWMRRENDCLLLASFAELWVTPAETEKIKDMLADQFSLVRMDTFVYVDDGMSPYFHSHWRGMEETEAGALFVSPLYDAVGKVICKAIPRLAEDFQPRRDVVPERTVKDGGINAPTIIVHRRRRRNKYGFPRYHWMHGKLTHSSLTYVR